MLSSADSHLAWIEIDIGALRHNYGEVLRITGGKTVLAAVKANAYGHGAVLVAKVLADEGVAHFGVSCVREALELREGGIEAEIVNLGPFAPGEARAVAANEITQAVFTQAGAKQLDGAGREAGREVGVHLKIDTGMGRLGVRFPDAVSFAASLSQCGYVRLEGVFSVLTEDPEFDRVQLERLRSILAEMKGQGIEPGHIHLVSSAGTIDFPEGHFGMVRPGIMLLGIYPNERSRLTREVELEPVLSFKARVARVANIPEGESLSYHRKQLLSQDTLVATLPVGHSHGYPRTAANSAEVLIRGKRFPVVADIPATALYVDLGGEREVKEGDEVVLIGSQGEETITADDLAAWAGVSSYGVVTALSPTLPRIEVGH